ncbi:flavodoxin family protein [Luteolibacter marinus]|uniref:flavodoxin family protein n=1 Tax=Luteolibacter marinus TaxID=2776705 RepID=UPI0018674DD7|nr:flavodoxin family protein [Luteolibacter marinus]
MTELRTEPARPLVSIIYHSGSGHTAEMSHAVAAGAASVDGVSVEEHRILESDFIGGRWLNEAVLARLDASDAIILGSPTYMGCVSSQMKSFMDSTSQRYLQRRWVDKIGAAFTLSGLAGGDKFNMLLTCATFAMQHGMVWVGVAESPVTGEGHNRLGYFFGAGGYALLEPPDEAPPAEDKATGRMLGRRVAMLARRLHAGAPVPVEA